jgi:cytochrome b561
MSHQGLRYTTVAILLHWAMAMLILLNIGIGLVMEGLTPPLKAIAVPFHFSCGMTVLVLAVLRILWRVTHRPPALPAIPPLSNLADAAQKTAHGRFVDAHAAGGWILIGMLVLHVAGALKHQCFDRQAELARMGVGRR